MRKAFSMLTAIFIIVLMATVAAFILNLSGKMVQETTTQFQREQAMLLAKSYTEYAIMAVTANDHTSATCLDTITGGYGDDGSGNDLYTINVDISYIGNNANLGGASGCNNILSSSVLEPKSPLNIIVDVFVSYPDLNHPDGLNMTYHRRSLQKI
ncbi:MAG: type II secretion system protein [Sulfurovum sp.]|uniref:type II secretion system protein n=1 Tax=Sulfurovum sp. TaxID=1969726 RepID=UPI0028680245|nr:type II secretion system protein [Sulfurovum sp.]MCO4845826.1 type II secretion system protein [Sulfurovum sp.]